jgi:hypothetical protein
MSILGDIPELSSIHIVARATHGVTGSSGHFEFLLSSASGISQYFSSHSYVRISGPVTFAISGPLSSSIASSVVVAAIPDKFGGSSDVPTTEAQIVQIPGANRAQHSLLVPTAFVPLTFPHEVADLLKPKTLIDFPPRIVGHYTIAGGSTQSKAIIVLSVPLEVKGTAFHKTW